MGGSTEEETQSNGKDAATGGGSGRSSNDRVVVENSSNSSSNPFSISLSLGFLLGSLIFVSATAFGVGRACRLYLLPPLVDTAAVGRGEETLVRSETLPLPILDKCKCLPNFTYTGKHYGTGHSTTSDNLLVRQEAADKADGDARCGCKNKEESAAGGGGGYQPAGQHLLVDIKNVDGMFLNSEQQLALAMVDLIQLSGLTMLSYHCHKLAPVGVSCVGVLLESHVSFHTWPIEGVITFDLFTCGESSLMPLLPVIERLFGVQRPVAVTGGPVEKPHTQWSYKPRGFRRNVKANPEMTTDLNQFMLGWMEYDMKTQLAEVDTDFQKVEVYQVISPRFRPLESYKKSLTNDGSYESQHPELFRPDKVVYLDGIMQSRLYGEAAYHEALVHPAMLAHDHPQRVAIIGGGEGATLREVLKHNTIETVTMVEIDEMMVNVSKTYLPEWSDCSNLKGSSRSCFDDPRTETYFTDAIAWFIERYLDSEASKKYDVIIMDALDPSEVVSFSDVLYDNDRFGEALGTALGDDGIFVVQVGEESDIGDPGAELTDRKYEVALMTHLQRHGFEVVLEYMEPHGGFMAPWGYLIAFKDASSKVNWYANQASIDLKLQRVAMETTDGSETPFRFFDGATMMGYQFGSRISEEVFCRTSPTPEKCALGHGFNPEIENIPASSLEVKQSTIPNGGRGVFFKEAVPKGKYLASELMVDAMYLPPLTTWMIRYFLKHTEHEFFKLLDVYMFGYGYGQDYQGMPAYSVEPSFLTFINHGCKGSYNYGHKMSVTEMTADPKQMPDNLASNPTETAFYNPFIDRNHLLLMHAGEITLRDIDQGEELLDNYLSYLTEENWESGLTDYRNQCSNQGVGAVNRYEDEAAAGEAGDDETQTKDDEPESTGVRDEL